MARASGAVLTLLNDSKLKKKHGCAPSISFVGIPSPLCHRFNDTDLILDRNKSDATSSAMIVEQCGDGKGIESANICKADDLLLPSLLRAPCSACFCWVIDILCLRM